MFTILLPQSFRLSSCSALRQSAPRRGQGPPPEVYRDGLDIVGVDSSQGHSIFQIAIIECIKHTFPKSTLLRVISLPGSTQDTELSAAARIEQWEREMRVTLGDAELTDTDEIDIGDVSLSTQSYTQPITETPAEPLFSFPLPPLNQQYRTPEEGAEDVEIARMDLHKNRIQPI